jgi:hypothetical protein
MTEDQIRELFREMRDEPVPPDSQARVRMAVAERTESWREKLRPRWNRHWKWIAAALVPACLLLVMVATREEKIAVPPPVVHPPAIAVVEPPAEVAAPLPPPPHRVRRVGHRAAKPPREVASKGATLIRIETPDPDVVILLVGG